MSRWDPDFPYVDCWIFKIFGKKCHVAGADQWKTTFWWHANSSASLPTHLTAGWSCSWMPHSLNLLTNKPKKSKLQQNTPTWAPEKFLCICSVVRFSSSLSSVFLLPRIHIGCWKLFPTLQNTKPELWRYSFLLAWLDLLFFRKFGLNISDHWWRHQVNNIFSWFKLYSLHFKIMVYLKISLIDLHVLALFVCEQVLLSVCSLS